MAIVTKSGKIALSMVQAGDSQNFWMLPNDYSASIPAGLYITKQSIDSFKANPSDSNIFMNSSRGIFIRNGSYNQIALQAGATDPSLRLYAPGGTGSEGELSVELTGGTNPVLNLYKIQGTTHTIAATLNTQGLTLKDGGIRGGDPNTSGFIYLSTNDYTGTGSSAITINGNSSNWRLIAGTQFGVTNAGALYASNVNIDGAIVAKSGRIGAASDGTGGWTITTDKLYSGTLGSNDSMYLATQDIDVGQNPPMIGGHTITNAQTETEGWRFTVGSGLGVTNEGKLYANGVEISGKFSATSLSTNGRDSRFDGQPGVYMDATGIYLGGSGTEPNGTNAFYVLADGALYATSGTITGSVYVGGNVSMGSEGSVTQLWQMAKKVLDYIKVATVDSNTGIKIANNVSQSTSYAFISDNGMRVYQNSNRVADFEANSIKFYSSNSKTIYSVSVLDTASENIREDGYYSSYISSGSTISFEKILGYPIRAIVSVSIWVYNYNGSGYRTFTVTPSASSQTYNGVTVSYSVNTTTKKVTITVTTTSGAVYVSNAAYIYKTSATDVSQVILGSLPITTSRYLLTIGNGYNSTLSNAMTVDFGGYLEVQGGIAMMGTDTSGNQRPFRPILIGRYAPRTSDGKEGDIYIQY